MGAILGHQDPIRVINVYQERRPPPQSSTLYSKPDELRSVLQCAERLALSDRVALAAYVQSRAALVSDTLAVSSLPFSEIFAFGL